MEFRVEPDHPALPGHFPGRPVVPGVVVLDHVLRALDHAHGVRGPLRLPQVKFAQPLLPGQDARIEIEARGEGRWRFRVLHGATLVASGEVAA